MCQYYEVCTRETSHLHCEDLNCDTKIHITYADKASRRRHYRKNHQHLLRNVGNPRKNNSSTIEEAMQQFRLAPVNLEEGDDALGVLTIEDEVEVL